MLESAARFCSGECHGMRLSRSKKFSNLRGKGRENFAPKNRQKRERGVCFFGICNSYYYRNRVTSNKLKFETALKGLN